MAAIVQAAVEIFAGLGMTCVTAGIVVTRRDSQRTVSRHAALWKPA